MGRNITIWTPEMDTFLTDNYQKLKLYEIGGLMAIHPSSISYRAAFLGLRKSPEAKSLSQGKIELTPERESFLKENFDIMTNVELAKALGLKLTITRYFLRHLALKKQEMEYWSVEQVQFLRDNYKLIGDKELARTFNKKWAKNKGWTHKHIEKKRRYLNLKRTAGEKAAIQQRNVDNGCFLLCVVKRWATTGQAKEGEIRMWRQTDGRFVPRIKIGGKFIHWNRWAWEQNFGPIPDGMNIIFSDNNPDNMDPSNLKMVTDADLSRRNSAISSQGLSDNYIAGMLTHRRPDLRDAIKNQPELIKLKRNELLLSRAIEQSTNGKSKR